MNKNHSSFKYASQYFNKLFLSFLSSPFKTLNANSFKMCIRDRSCGCAPNQRAGFFRDTA